jgi:hypothetical protein
VPNQRRALLVMQHTPHAYLGLIKFPDTDADPESRQDRKHETADRDEPTRILPRALVRINAKQHLRDHNSAARSPSGLEKVYAAAVPSERGMRRRRRFGSTCLRSGLRRYVRRVQIRSEIRGRWSSRGRGRRGGERRVKRVNGCERRSERRI